MSDLSLNEREAALHKHLRSLKSVAIAYSGGLDSRFLSYTSLRLGLKIQAFHVTGPHIPAQESVWAKTWAEQNHLPLTLLSIDPLQSQVITANPPDRCYHCKTTVFTTLKQHISEGVLCDGTNTSDSEGYRPGLRALKELGIVSPLALAGLSKPDIRALARKTGMDRPEQAAHPCLFTRFNYGISPTHKTLTAVDETEEAIEQVLRAHVVLLPLPGSASSEKSTETVPFRLRFEDKNKTVLHIAKDKLEPKTLEALQQALQKNGFAKTPVVLVDKISGHFDRLQQHQA
jgi:uncharacterized protein